MHPAESIFFYAAGLWAAYAVAEYTTNKFGLGRPMDGLQPSVLRHHHAGVGSIDPDKPFLTQCIQPRPEVGDEVYSTHSPCVSGQTPADRSFAAVWNEMQHDLLSLAAMVQTLHDGASPNDLSMLSGIQKRAALRKIDNSTRLIRV